MVIPTGESHDWRRDYFTRCTSRKRKVTAIFGESMMIEMRALLLLLAGMIVIVLLFACTTSPVALTDTQSAGAIDTVDGQVAHGELIYQQACATCHGLQGEGKRLGDTFAIWPLVGEDFQARNPNAQVVFDVVRSRSEPSLRALTDTQIYDAIAYVWNLNDPEGISQITAQNAASIPPGETMEALTPAGVYPPLGNVLQLAAPPAAIAQQTVANGYMGMRVDQIIRARAIGNITAAPGHSFVIIVFALQNLGGQPLDLDPKFLRLEDAQMQVLSPQAIDLASPIERFHAQTIQPEHGTAAIAVFALPGGVDWQLVYDDQTGYPLSVSLES
jgi:mono/diheme cytochrome c family protein